jgi:hypothetical protein
MALQAGGLKSYMQIETWFRGARQAGRRREVRGQLGDKGGRYHRRSVLIAWSCGKKLTNENIKTGRHMEVKEVCRESRRGRENHCHVQGTGAQSQRGRDVKANKWRGGEAKRQRRIRHKG